MRGLKILKDERGIAAIEFALIVPVLVGMLLFGADGWLQFDQTSKMRSALQAGARYYQGGGSDDAAAANLAMQAWAPHPDDGQVSVVRSCLCGNLPAACSTLCANSNLPTAYVNFTASGTYTGLLHTASLTQSGAVRIR